MKVLFLFVLAAVQCLFVESANVLNIERVDKDGDINLGEDPNFKCPQTNGVFPHPTNCELYYQCWENTITTLWQCRDNYLFDLTYDGCNFPQLTDCGERVPPGQVFNCSSSNGLFPMSPNACSHNYYNCTNNVSTIQTCTNDYIFDPQTSVCTPPASASCQIPTTSTTQTPPTGSGDINLGEAPDFKCPAMNGVFPHPTQCELFYECWENTITTLWQCRNNLVFDLTYSGCNFLEYTDCGDRIPPGQVFNCPSSNGLFPVNPNVCSHNYYSCSNNVPTILTCPNDYIFDPKLSVCTPPASASCQIATTSTTPTPPTAPGPFSCAGKPDGNYPSPYTCTQFYTCLGGVDFLNNCPTGLYYNPLYDYCDYPANVPGCTGF